MLHLVEQELHRLDGVQGLEHLPQYPYPVELFLREEQVFLPRAGLVQVYGREYSSFSQLPVEDDFHVAGSLELFEYDLVHTASGLDEGGGDDGQATAFLDVPGCSKEPLGLMQGVGVDAAGEHLSGGRYDRVVGPGEPRYRIKQDHDILL